MNPKILTASLLCSMVVSGAAAQQLFTSNEQLSMHQLSRPRPINYWPEGQDFVTINGSNRFTRALYGSNTGFRLETSDYPEFALYMPNMGGNLTFRIEIQDAHRKAVRTIDLSSSALDVECRYRPGRRIYKFALPADCREIAGQPAEVTITAMALYDYEAAIWRIEANNVRKQVLLAIAYGGATNARFSREGDMGVDKKDCFDFKIENCQGNEWTLSGSHFALNYGKGSKRGERTMSGWFSADSRLVSTPAQAPNGSEVAYLTAYMPLAPAKGKKTTSTDRYFIVGSAPSFEARPLPQEMTTHPDAALAALFQKALTQIEVIASTERIETPDPVFNTVGGAMSMAADAIWGDEGVWLHGSIGWRMPLCGWRAAYTGDVMGWHDRAQTHFDNYAHAQLSQTPVIYPEQYQDSSKHLARGLEKLGTPVYSNGYICRLPNDTKKLNHYDMNLVYMDELLWHFNWTGDWDYVYRMWPVIERHLSWEKRNFDPNNDGLYDAYCCIWASDALYYSGGAVTHSSAYNYRANKIAAAIARHFSTDAKCVASGEATAFAASAERYEQESARILSALNTRLWLTDAGVWAECQDELGLKRRHGQPAVWTIYHAIDSDVATPMQAFTATQYVDNEIPHIPIVAAAPSVSAQHLAASAVAAQTLYNDISTGGYATVATTNWQPYAWSINNVALAEVSHTALAYWEAGRNDAAYKLLKSALLDAMYLGGSPGNFGQISYYDAARSECYRDFGDPVGITSRTIVQGLFGVRPDRLHGRVYVVPGFPSSWDHASIETPDYALSYRTNTVGQQTSGAPKTTLTYHASPSFASDTLVLRLKAPFSRVQRVVVGGKTLSTAVGQFSCIAEGVEYPMVELKLCIAAASGLKRDNRMAGSSTEIVIEWGGSRIDVAKAHRGARSEDGRLTQYRQDDMCWWMPEAQPNRDFTTGSLIMDYFDHVDSTRLEMIELDGLLNASVTDLFKQKYLSPRYPHTTLALPTQGIGEWCHPLDSFDIDDSYLRRCAAQQGFMPTSLHVPFRTTAQGHNILFTSLWDNYPNRATVPLSGTASRAYLFMTGTTNAMQSRIANGVVRVLYADGSADSLLLINPETWWPIDQDYLDGTPAFYLKLPAPYRQCLSTSVLYRPQAAGLNKEIPGGAGMLLDLPLQQGKKLRALELETLSNDVVIGLLSVTLQR